MFSKGSGVTQNGDKAIEVSSSRGKSPITRRDAAGKVRCSSLSLDLRSSSTLTRKVDLTFQLSCSSLGGRVGESSHP